MKMKNLLLSIIALLAFNALASANQIEVVFVSKAYWDGQTKSCLSRDHGCCIHISFRIPVLENQIIGDLNYNDVQGLTYTVSKSTGILPVTMNTLIKGGKFYFDGEGTFSEEILKSLNLPPDFKIKPGYYPVDDVNGKLIIRFK
jgi:hypothetical protein